MVLFMSRAFFLQRYSQIDTERFYGFSNDASSPKDVCGVTKDVCGVTKDVCGVRLGVSGLKTGI
jgi:hypothetical protein